MIENSALTRLDSEENYGGRDGARSFWSEYLSSFKEIHSRFTKVIEAGNTAVLKWEAQSRFESGEPIHYRGVGIVEFQDDKVRRFRTYYDSARLSNMLTRKLDEFTPTRYAVVNLIRII